MTPLPSPGAVVQLALKWQVDDDTAALTRLFFSYTGGAPSASALTSVCAAVDTAVDTYLGPLFLATTLGIGTKAIDLSSDTGAEGESTTSNAGSRTGARLAPGTAVTVSHEINRRYRGGHPRSYLPFGAGADVGTNGEWTSGFLTEVVTGYANFITVVLANGVFAFQHETNVSYYHGNMAIIDPVTGRARNIPQKRTTPVVDQVQSNIVRAKIGSQRRRNRNS